MTFQGRTETTRDDWQTPIELVRALGAFDLDVCANVNEPHRLAPNAFFFGYDRWGRIVGTDALLNDWKGRAFMNPPYGGAQPAREWMRKLGEHGDGVALIPPRMGSKWFHEIVLAKCDAILFLKGRVAFINAATGFPVDGNNADSILIAYGERNVEALRNCGLAGKLWELSK